MTDQKSGFGKTSVAMLSWISSGCPVIVTRRKRPRPVYAVNRPGLFSQILHPLLGSLRCWLVWLGLVMISCFSSEKQLIHGSMRIAPAKASSACSRSDNARSTARSASKRLWILPAQEMFPRSCSVSAVRSCAAVFPWAAAWRRARSKACSQEYGQSCRYRQ